MPDYTQEEILQAWKTFISRGIILEDKVRPAVARSWTRCRDHGLDPWSADYPKCSDSMLKQRRSRYADIWALAGVVMKYTFALLDCNISISDHEGFVYELMTPLKSYPRTLGTFVNESTVGNGAITIALKEHIPVRTEGYEHYRVIAHSSSNVSAPIMIDGRLVGVLNAVSPFGSLPAKTLPLIVAAVKMIERLLTEKDPFKLYYNAGLLGEIIDCCTKAVLIVDQAGTIVAANQTAKIITAFPGQDIVNQSLAAFLAEKRDCSILLESGEEEYTNWNFRLLKSRSAQEDGSAHSCMLEKKKKVGLINGDVHTVLVFDPAQSTDLSEHVAAPKKSGGAAGSLLHGPGRRIHYIGNSPAWAKINDLIQKTAPYPSNVLLLGETGTGKEVVAQAIHRLSKRKGCFVAVNCGAIPKDLLHSELFGYEAGAFTGAKAQGSIGKFEHAHEGTLLLDEISEMPLDMQVSLLRFIQERTVTRINSNKSKPVDVRIIAATNRDMLALVHNGQFREDLYYRLNVIEIKLPSLRERKGDIPLLAEHFVAELSKQFNVPPLPISPDVLEILSRYHWPGNVRELKNVIEKALVLSEGLMITPDALPSYLWHSASDPAPGGANDITGNSEREQIVRALEQHGGNILKTAKALNMARNTLYRKIEKYNIELKTTCSPRKNQ